MPNASPSAVPTRQTWAAMLPGLLREALLMDGDPMPTLRNIARSADAYVAANHTPAVPLPGRVDLTPTWSGILPMMVLIYRDAGKAARRGILGELARMAAIADMQDGGE